MAQSTTAQPPVDVRQPDASTPESAAASTPPDQAAATMLEATASPSPRRTLLVVDDQPNVCASVAYFLEVCGYRTLRAESGQAAIDLLGKEHVDGVLLDVQMPKLNGLETSVRLNELARAANRQIKVWFMTGIHYRELNDECAKAGGVAVFRKPFDWPRLLAELAEGLASPPQVAQPGAAPAPDPQ